MAQVEMFVVCTPEQSDALHQELIQIEQELFTELGLHFKVGGMRRGGAAELQGDRQTHRGLCACVCAEGEGVLGPERHTDGACLAATTAAAAEVDVDAVRGPGRSADHEKGHQPVV